MGLKLTLDHVNIRTANLAAMEKFYAEVLDLTPGARPDFGAPGAWLYAEEKHTGALADVRDDYRAAWVHFVEVPAAEVDQGSLQIEHFAFAATGMEQFLARLNAAGCKYTLAELLDVGLVQVNFRDPDGNHIHVDFPLSEKSQRL
jgi:catechol 2,3-dioxygenase-like lactoylglutathione lyase family enzyme